MSPPFAAVYFDCDSTLSSIEGVDELLQFADPALRKDIAELTTAAMNGTLPLAEVYESRLSKLAPHRQQLDVIGEHYVSNLVPDAKATIQALQFLGKGIGIVSGGLLIPVQHIARHLGVPLEHVHAVPLIFHDDGSYRDFDHTSPLWQNGGKIPIVQGAPPAHHPMVFVGDGITDLETKAHVARFIGFGGVVARDAVQKNADYFVAAPSLAAILPHVLTEQEIIVLEQDPNFSSLLS
ncbi:MAG: phosphoserine phosphatase [Planctomycetota bacterium]